MNSPEKLTPAEGLAAITGAAGGLGKAFAVECASRGWDLFLTDLPSARLDDLAAGLRRAYGVRVITHGCDLTDPASRELLFDTIQAESLHFWALFNVAGIDFEGPFCEQTRRQICTVIRLNIEGTLDMTHTLLQHRAPRSPFRIINVASLAAFAPMPAKATYAASKRFLLDFSLALREEVRGMGATVTVLCPAGLPTTPDCIEAIAAQGWMGIITTQDIGRVADETINAALRGSPVVIPGAANHLLKVLSGLVPARLAAGLVGSRWNSARRKRGLQNLPAAT